MKNREKKLKKFIVKIPKDGTYTIYENGTVNYVSEQKKNGRYRRITHGELNLIKYGMKYLYEHGYVTRIKLLEDGGVKLVKKQTKFKYP